LGPAISATSARYLESKRYVQQERLAAVERPNVPLLLAGVRGSLEVKATDEGIKRAHFRRADVVLQPCRVTLNWEFMAADGRSNMAT